MAASGIDRASNQHIIEAEKPNHLKQFIREYAPPKSGKVIYEYTLFDPLRTGSDKFRVGLFEDRGWLLVRLTQFSWRKPTLDEATDFVNQFRNQRGVGSGTFHGRYYDHEVNVAFRDLIAEREEQARSELERIQQLRNASPLNK